MKFNPYAVLLTTGALMLATVVFAQTGASIALLKAGATSVDRDVSSFAARTFSWGGRPDERPAAPAARVASLDRAESVSQEW